MPINFIPNDPMSLASMPMRSKTPRPDRPATRAGFNFFSPAPQGRFSPGTPEFLFWQCREAALLAVEVWERLNGNLTQWAPSAPNRRKLDLMQDVGFKLNAFYDGLSLQFFHHTTGAKTTFSGASTDVVAHEAGHAFLDVLRPEFFSSALTEVNAFHEAFGDCVAILCALFDRPTRVALLAPPSRLAQANFVEALAEDLSDGIRRGLGASHPASAPRRSRNNFQFQLPTTLPTFGPPDVLTAEIHSFGRVFAGCFYDTIVNIFAASPARTQTTLLNAARTAGKLLVAAARNAPEVPRFFQSVGRAMVLEDDATNAGANRQAVIDAFAGHNIALGSTAMLAPRASLAGSAPKLSARARGPLVSPATAKDIKTRIGAGPNARLSFSAVSLGGERVAKAVHNREVSLGGLSQRLRGVVAIVPETLLVGGSGMRAAALSAIPDASTSADEVNTFVETLLKHGHIAFDEGGGGSKKSAVAAGGGRRSARKLGMVGMVGEDRPELPTHAVVSRGGKRVLERLRFLCRPED